MEMALEAQVAGVTKGALPSASVKLLESTSLKPVACWLALFLFPKVLV